MKCCVSCGVRIKKENKTGYCLKHWNMKRKTKRFCACGNSVSSNSPRCFDCRTKAMAKVPTDTILSMIDSGIGKTKVMERLGISRSVYERAIRTRQSKSSPLMDDLIRKTARRFGFSEEAIKGKGRHKDLVKARSAFVRASISLGCSYSAIGRYISRDHSTIINLSKRAEWRISRDPDYERSVKWISRDDTCVEELKNDEDIEASENIVEIRPRMVMAKNDFNTDKYARREYLAMKRGSDMLLAALLAA